MKKFTIQPNEYLKKEIQGFYHDDYHGGGAWKIDGRIENLITTLKNDSTPFNNFTIINEEHIIIKKAKQQLVNILKRDLQEILNLLGKQQLTACVVPRSKNENYYKPNQKLFRKVVSMVVDQIKGYENGTKYIIRVINTRSNTLNRFGLGGDGPLPYPGITKKTCKISENVKGKDILLIDDVYTKTVNVDEDAIQALLDKGARTVYFYAVGKTIEKQSNPNIIIE